MTTLQLDAGLGLKLAGVADGAELASAGQKVVPLELVKAIFIETRHAALLTSSAAAPLATALLPLLTPLNEKLSVVVRIASCRRLAHGSH